jgi:methylmalonyl-CoA/ethylmalonyl-CoA epimerase
MSLPELVFDHVGIVVADIRRGAATLSGLVPGLSWTQPVDDAGLGVSVCFARDGTGLVYELIAPLGDASPVARALKNRTDLLNHLAYRTPSLEAGVKHLRTQGALPVGSAKPAIAFGGARVQFLMTPLGVLFELIEKPQTVYNFDHPSPADGS